MPVNKVSQVLLGACAAIFFATPEASVRSTSISRLQRREVPQEWSHGAEVRTVDVFLKKNNPMAIQHPIFSLLGDAAASKGLGMIDPKNIDCFQKLVADQAFTNAKKEGNSTGQEAAIIFASLEKNALGVGKTSASCASTTASNPEIQRLIQHQDPASSGAKENNVKSALLAAESLRDIGSDPNLAIRSGTFAPGKTEDSTGRGFSCDDEFDLQGCIFTKNLLVPDVSEEEIKQHLAQNSTQA